MPKFLKKRWHGYYTVWAFILLLLLVMFVTIYNWTLGLISLILASVLGIVMIKAEMAFRRELNDYINGLTIRIKRMEGEAVSMLPFGIVLYSEDRTVEWHNRFVAEMFHEKTLVGSSMPNLFPNLPQPKEKKEASKEPSSKEFHDEFQLDDRYYGVIHNPQERYVYVYEITELAILRDKYENERIALGILILDNLDEAAQGMDDQQRTALIARVTSEITAWAKQYEVYLRRLSSDRYLMMLNHKSLQELEQSRFVILDEVREMTADLKVPMTLSVGLAFGSDSISELGELAQSSLDMALGRGGDQAAVKAGQRLSFTVENQMQWRSVPGSERG